MKHRVISGASSVLEGYDTVGAPSKRGYNVDPRMAPHVERFVIDQRSNKCSVRFSLTRDQVTATFRPRASSSMAEQLTLNQPVPGSSPGGLTNYLVFRARWRGSFHLGVR